MRIQTTSVRDWAVGLAIFVAWFFACAWLGALSGNASLVMQQALLRFAASGADPALVGVIAFALRPMLGLAILALGGWFTGRLTSRPEVLFLARGPFLTIALGVAVLNPPPLEWLPPDAARIYGAVSTGALWLAVAVVLTSVAFVGIRWLVLDERAARKRDTDASEASGGRLS
ncbi:MAG: hypothetical protein Q7W30_04500 [Coriobacteriia bacterium]|nr:hypothetical protein [Coriobacteriia bacterium]